MYRIIDAAKQYGDSFDTPAVIVLEDRMRENISRMQAFADEHGVALRPHVKTHKSIDIAHLQMRAGAVGITVSNLYQAEVFAVAGITDVFVAFPVWVSDAKAKRIRSLLDRVHLKIGVESREAVDAFARQGLAGVLGLELVIEVDCGAGRTGVAPEQAGGLAAYAEQAGLRVAGVYTYPGHGWAAGAAEGAARDQELALATSAESLRSAGVEPRIVSAGSTPTAKFSTGSVITEIRPGEYVFYSMDHYNHQVCAWDDIALFVLTTVVSRGSAERQIIDVGTMALGREVNADGNYGWIAGNGGAVSRLNEYHGFLDVGEGPEHAIGTVLPLIPNHSCTVVQNFKELIVLNTETGTHEIYPVNQFGRPA